MTTGQDTLLRERYEAAVEGVREATVRYVLAADALQAQEDLGALRKDEAVARRRADMDAANEAAAAQSGGTPPKPTSYEAGERTVMLDPQYRQYRELLRRLQDQRRRLEAERAIALAALQLLVTREGAVL